jgi:predicted metal-binding protein
MQTLESVVKDLENIAVEGGATAIKRIKPQDVVVAQWVRNKCQVGCRHFGKRFHCPPYSPTPEETRKVLQDYSEAVLVEFANLERDKLREAKGKPVIHTTLYNMERAAFLKGYQKALVYEAGPCALCEKCPAEELDHLTFSDKKLCKHPKEARPAMEAAGIDVYSTVRRAGLEIHVVRDRSEQFKVFGLLLLE